MLSVASPPGFTHIPALDAHFLSTIQRPATSLSSLNRGDVLEIQGPPSSGKTHLLYHLLVTCILPSSHLSTNIGGWGKAAIICDTDATFDILRINQLLLSRLNHLLSFDSYANPDSAQEITKMSLEKLHIFRPMSSIQLAVTITHLPAYHAAHIPDTEIGLLAIDSISAFYWPDRFTVEQMRSAPPTAEPRKQAPNFASPLQHVLTALQSFRLSHSPVIALINWGLIPLNEPSPVSTPTFYKQHLHPFPLPFSPNPNAPRTNVPMNHSFPTSSAPLPITHHITIPSTTIPPFNPGISLEEAKAQEEQRRKEIVERGELVGIVRTPGSTKIGRFTFRIGDTHISTS